MDTLAEDAAGLIAALVEGPVHFIGLSMGGFIGLRLAIHRPELIKSLVLLESSADPEPAENVAQYLRLNLVARWVGLGVPAKKVMPVMFGKKFLEDPARKHLRREMKDRIRNNDRLGITRAVKGVIYREGVYEQLPKIQAPTLVLVGDQDKATEPDKAQRMADQIAGANLVTLEGAGHTATIEEPGQVNEALGTFLQMQLAV